VFSSYSRLVLLKSTNHQHSWNSSVITATTTVDVHSLSVYAGVDGIYFVLNSRQQAAGRACFVGASAVGVAKSGAGGVGVRTAERWGVGTEPYGFR